MWADYAQAELAQPAGQEDALRTFFSRATELPLDAQGRLLIPQTIRKRLGIEGQTEITLLGHGNRLALQAPAGGRKWSIRWLRDEKAEENVFRGAVNSILLAIFLYLNIFDVQNTGVALLAAAGLAAIGQAFLFALAHYEERDFLSGFPSRFFGGLRLHGLWYLDILKTLLTWRWSDLATEYHQAHNALAYAGGHLWGPRNANSLTDDSALIEPDVPELARQLLNELSGSFSAISKELQNVTTNGDAINRTALRLSFFDLIREMRDVQNLARSRTSSSIPPGGMHASAYELYIGVSDWLGQSLITLTTSQVTGGSKSLLLKEAERLEKRTTDTFAVTRAALMHLSEMPQRDSVPVVRTDERHIAINIESLGRAFQKGTPWQLRNYREAAEYLIERMRQSMDWRDISDEELAQRLKLYLDSYFIYLQSSAPMINNDPDNFTLTHFESSHYPNGEAVHVLRRHTDRMRDLASNIMFDPRMVRFTGHDKSKELSVCSVVYTLLHLDQPAARETRVSLLTISPTYFQAFRDPTARSKGDPYLVLIDQWIINENLDVLQLGSLINTHE